MHRICVLVSGGGTTLQAIIDAIDDGKLDAKIAAVISSRPGAYALTRARSAGIQAVELDYRKKGEEEYNDALFGKLVELSPDLICLAGYLKILDSRTVDRFSGRIINIHPALLPSFGGRGMYGMRVHEAVLSSGATESGCTVHFVTDGVDAGPVIYQERVPVLPGDTPEALAARVHGAEVKAYPAAIRKVLSGDAVMA